MEKNLKKGIRLIEAMIVFGILWFVFWHVAQPVLANIYPMFAPQYVSPAEQAGRAPETPAQVALFVFGLVGYFVYVNIKYSIVKRYKK